jgi:4-amino-4-deoxy-L-arabinose transferase-like glycosyltransferase
MAVLLPLLAAALLFVFHARRNGLMREALVDSALLLGLLVVVCSEGLSLPHWYTRAGVATFWGVVIAAAAVAVFRQSPRPPLPAGGAPAGCWRALGPLDRALVLSVGSVAAALLVVAVMAPPNTWDALTYHMPRVVAWIQNRSVDHFPTHNSRQLEFPPFAEYVVAQFQILLGTDRLANLGQWSAMVGSVLTSSLLAQRLGAGPRGQILAAVVCVTIPPGILEATGAKNDYTAAFWTLCATLKLHDVWRASDPRDRAEQSVRFGAAIGLAMLTKGTVYIFAWPILALLASLALWRHRRRAILPLAVAGCLAVAINVPHFARDYRVIGDIFGSQASRRTMENKRYAPWIVASNVLRNLAAQMATPSAAFNDRILYEPVVRLHRLVGKDPDDWDTTGDPRFIPFRVNWGLLNDDNSGGALHVPLILACLAAAPFIPGMRRRAPLALALAAALVVSFLTFCLMINWQPWHGRYFIVLFVLWAPLLGLFLESLPRPAAHAVAAVLLAAALPYVLFNQTRPLLGPRNVFDTPRLEQYFAARPELLTPYRNAAQFVARQGVHEVGLLAGGDTWVYAFRAALQERVGRRVRIDYLNGFAWPPDAGKVRIPAAERPPGPVVVVLPNWTWATPGPAPRVLTNETGSRYYVTRDLGDAVVFTRKPRSFDGKVFFGAAWFGLEYPEWGWANWMPRTATLSLTRSTAGDVLLDGQMISSTVPNTVTFRVNGADVASLDVDWHHNRAFGPIRLPLRAGDNTIELHSQARPVTTGADTRPRAVLLGNLTLTSPATGRTTQLDPVQPDPARNP